MCVGRRWSPDPAQPLLAAHMWACMHVCVYRPVFGGREKERKRGRRAIMAFNSSISKDTIPTPDKQKQQTHIAQTRKTIMKSADPSRRRACSTTCLQASSPPPPSLHLPDQLASPIPFHFHVHSILFRSVPFHSLPFSNPPFHSIPFDQSRNPLVIL